MKIYEAIRSSASFRVRIALNLKDLPYESEVLDLRAGDHLRDAYARINPQRAIAQLVACEMHPLNNLRVLGYLERELRLSEPAREAWYAHWVREGFRSLEPMLADRQTGRFCHGDAPTVADVFLVPQVVNAQRFKVDLADFPRAVGVFERCIKLPAFERAHPAKHPAGT